MDFVELLDFNRDEILKALDPRGDLLVHMLSEDLADYDDRDRIRQTKQRRMMAEMVIELVREKSMSDSDARERFIRCLQNSGQQHISMLLSEQLAENDRSPELPMTDEHRCIIRTKLVSLVQSIDPEGNLLCNLRSLEVINDRDIDKIRNQKSADEMNEILLADILPFKPDSAFTGLVTALKMSDQPHVANLLMPNNACDEIPLSTAHRDFLTHNLSHLVSHIQPHYGLLSSMIARGIVSERDTQRIETNSTTDAMNESILRILQRKPDSVFLKFLAALEDNNQEHVLTKCYGHTIKVQLNVNTVEVSRKTEAEQAIVRELPSKMKEVEGNVIEEVRMKCIVVTFRVPTTETLRRLREKQEEGRLSGIFEGPVGEILATRNILWNSVTADINPYDYAKCLARFDKIAMSDKHRDFLAIRQFDPSVVVSDRLLTQLHGSGALLPNEMLQIQTQLRMDDRREKLFDALKRKPDELFSRIEMAFCKTTSGDDINGKNSDIHPFNLSSNDKSIDPDGKMETDYDEAKLMKNSSRGYCIITLLTLDFNARGYQNSFPKLFIKA